MIVPDSPTSQPGDPGGHANAMTSAADRFFRFCRMALKELRETIRDRRTIITLVMMPILVYPLLSVVFQKFLLSSVKQTSQRVFHVGINNELELMILIDLLKRVNYSGRQTIFEIGDTEFDQTSPDGASDAVDVPDSSNSNPQSNSRLPQTKFIFYRPYSLETAVENQEVDVSVRLELKDRFRWQDKTYPLVDCHFIYSSQSINSQDAYDELYKRLTDASLHLMEFRLKSLGIKSRVVPVSMALTNLQLRGGKSMSSVSLSTLVPMILILMTMTGAVYPAIDLTAGERERGTLEAVMATPASHFTLLLAKYVAVLAVAMMTASLNVASMAVTLLSSGLGRILFGDQGLPLLVVAEVFGLILLFAMFFSAVLLAVTSFARSFKEAQAYLIPLMLVSLAPGILSLMPEMKLSGWMAMIPLVNCILLARDLFSQTAQLNVAVVVVGTTVIYACVALVLAGRIFGTDVWQPGGAGTWSELLKGQSTREEELPTWNHALFSLAVLIPVFLLATQMTARFQQLSVTGRLMLNAGLTVALFALWPALLAKLQHVNFRKTFQLTRCRWLDLLAAVLFGVSIWPVAFELVVWGREWGLVSYDMAHLEQFQELLSSWKQASPLTILIVLAVIPAACEEFFFRGYVFSALRGRHSPVQTVIYSAILFGAFHLIVTDFLAWERLAPSTLLGCLLGWVCYKSGSLFPGVMLHTVHNGLLLMIAYYREELQQRGWDVADESHLPLWILLTSLFVIAGGCLLLLARKRTDTAV